MRYLLFGCNLYMSRSKAVASRTLHRNLSQQNNAMDVTLARCGVKVRPASIRLERRAGLGRDAQRSLPGEPRWPGASSRAWAGTLRFGVGAREDMVAVPLVARNFGNLGVVPAM